jgi:hypothetical protein
MSTCSEFLFNIIRNAYKYEYQSSASIIFWPVEIKITNPHETV